MNFTKLVSSPTGGSYHRLILPLSGRKLKILSTTTILTAAVYECVLMLDLNAPVAELMDDFTLGADFQICKGFAVGRTLFQDAAKSWFNAKINDKEAIRQIAENYDNLLRSWNNIRN